MAKALLKLHLHLVEVRGYTYRVLTLRPSHEVQLSNNYYHQTWHLLAGVGGAEILAQLLWGLAFQKKPGTLILLDAPHIKATPFEADKALPCVLAPAGLTCIDAEMLRTLRHKMSQRGMPTTTVKWQTFGLEGADELYDKVHPLDQELEHLWQQERMELRGGLICYTAPSMILRLQALSVRRVSEHLYFGSNYTYLAQGDWRKRHHADGEVQVFADFEDRVAAASIAREQILEAPAVQIYDQATRERIWKKTETITSARMAARKGRGRSKPHQGESLDNQA